MAVTATPVMLQKATPSNKAQILPADTTTNKTLITASTDGTKVLAILVTSTDTSARDIQLKKTVSGTDHILGTFSIPITAGFINSTPTVNLFNHTQMPYLPRDANGNPYLQLESGATLTVASLTTVTAAKVISIVACASSDYS